MMLLAHSADSKRNAPVQGYAEHIDGTVKLANESAVEVAKYARHDGDVLINTVKLAAEFHDLGKLDKDNQEVLSGKRKAKSLPIQHTDAGAAYLLNRFEDAISAVLVRSHHIGLPDFIEEQNRGDRAFRDNNVFEKVNQTITKLTHLHETVRPIKGIANKEDIKGAPQIFFRIALSCLADGDHTDTGIHYGGQINKVQKYLLRPAERLAALDKHVESLKGIDQRSQLRSDVYIDCRSADVEGNMASCNSPVGTGKTTAVMAHLLAQAKKRKLRRIIVVLPYTNIITQSVEVYRRALLLPNEDPNQVVAELHHRAEFQDKLSRQFTSLWNSPIIVTTAVSFFETIASNVPSALRRLHNLPGSAVFIDESHSALPAKLWPLAWQWIKEYANNWSCYWVLASGSLNRFWEIEEFDKERIDMPELIPDKRNSILSEYENNRITYQHKKESLSASQLVHWVSSFQGPRLLIVNTVQSAAAIAKEFEKQYGRNKVEHLSTALIPLDREHTINRIKTRLRLGCECDWTLVATSCVESGVDVSFKNGFREASSLVSLLQTAGRVNRHGNDSEAGIWSIILKEDGILKTNPRMRDSAKVLLELFALGKTISPSLCTNALQREIRLGGTFNQNILNADNNMRFPQVEKDFQVIASDTRIVVIDKTLIEKIENYHFVSWQEIQKYSVQIWGYRLDDLKISEISNCKDIYKWNYAYDDFIGYMAGILPVETIKRGDICIV